MKGDFQITLAYLKDIEACREGQREFQKHFPNGGGYQEVLDKCAELDRYDLGSWLMNRLGPTDEVRIYEEEIDDPKKTILFAGRLEFRRSVSVKRVRAGCGIEAGYGIKAGEGIEAGDGIKAGEGIEAGDGIEAGWGIEAGRGIKAGCGIEAGYGIKAGCGIEAGCGIKAGCGIEAGDGYGIFAGLRIRIPEWPVDAVVTAKKKPENLISGHWKEGVQR